MSRQFRSGPVCGVSDLSATSDTSNARSGANCSSGPEVNEKKLCKRASRLLRRYHAAEPASARDRGTIVRKHISGLHRRGVSTGCPHSGLVGGEVLAGTNRKVGGHPFRARPKLAGIVTARRCARAALAKLGYAPAPIRSGPKREPQWPFGLVGSITHTTGYRAAAVAPRSILASVGIDTEENGPLPDGIEESVTVPGESEMLAALARAFPATHWGRLLFSAKESTYKAWYPLTDRWLGFEDARVTIDPAGTFAAKLAGTPIRSRGSGKSGCRGGIAGVGSSGAGSLHS
jgi:4'-phosphopantetheinyl transferase EntD